MADRSGVAPPVRFTQDDINALKAGLHDLDAVLRQAQRHLREDASPRQIADLLALNIRRYYDRTSAFLAQKTASGLPPGRGR